MVISPIGYYISFIIFGFFLFVDASESVTYLDRKCGNSLNNVWLDVIILVDNSKTITDIKNVSKSILDIFDNGTRIGTSDIESRTTRVSLITYNRNAEILADFNKFQSFNDLKESVSSNLANVSSYDESYLFKGLEAAAIVLEKSSEEKERMNYKKVILIYTKSDDDFMATIPLFHRLKEDGITIVIVDGINGNMRNFSRSSIINLELSIHDSDLVAKVQDSFLQANCFCPNGWTQLRTSHSDINSYRYGICLSLNSLHAVWRAARISCGIQWKNGYLVNEYDLNKHNYVLEALRNSSLFRHPYTYYIGLSYSNGDWNWEQPDGKSMRSLKEQSWNNWDSGYPLISSTQTVGLNVQSNNDKIGWQNTIPMGEAHYYVCEVAACDTDTYCEYVVYKK